MTIKRMSDRDVMLAVMAKALNVCVASLDVSKSFTELGGHSLSAVEVQHGCGKAQVAKPPTVLSLLVSPTLEALLPQEEDGQTGLMPSKELASVVVTAKDPLDTMQGVQVQQVTEMDDGYIAPALDEPALQCVQLEAVQDCSVVEAPATDMQAGLIRGHRSTINYFETWSLPDVVLVQHAWKKVIALEPIFRTEFVENNTGGFTLRLGEETSNRLEWDETVTFDQQSYRAAIDKVLSQTQSSPTFHFHTIVFAAQDSGRSEATIALSVHHALLDGCSMDLLVEKVRRVASGEPVAGPGTSFLEAAAEIKELQQHCSADAEDFWGVRKTMHPNATAKMGLPPPSFKATASQADSDGENGEIDLSFEHLHEPLQAQCRSLGVTVAAFFHAAWALVQAAYSDSDDVVFGSILSGRNLPIQGIGTVVGPLVNSLPLHVAIARDMEAAEFVQTVFADLAEMSGFQWSSPAHGFARDFEAALSVSCGLKSPSDHKLRPLRRPSYEFESSVPLSIALDQASLSMRMVYHSKLYERSVAEELAGSFVSALTGLTSSSTRKVQQCLDAVMTAPMQGRLRVLGNCVSGATTRAAHEGQDLIDLFDAAVQKEGPQAAIDAGDGRVWSYDDVNKKSRQLAAELSRMGLQPGAVVCVHADGGASWVLGLLATLRAGGIFCSLDASLPSTLRTAMFEASGSSICIVGEEWQRKFLPQAAVACLVVDTLLRKGAADSEEMDRSLTPARASRAREPAYLCFTSGSTGTPKGVLCTHQGLVAFQKDEAVRLGARSGVRIAQFMSPGFDGSIHEIFSALSYGATLVMRRNVDPFEVLSRVDSAIMTPSVARTISPQEFPNLQRIYLVGEQVPATVVSQWAPGRQLYNMYGPTEGTGGATITRLYPKQTVTIGRPNPTSRVYILGRHGQLLPRGAVGEIHIAGVQVAIGYINNPEQTGERFKPDSICQGLNEMMYTTGDRGYWDTCGSLVCLGRNDRQLKLRGFRLDLDDLEARILQGVPEVEAVALTKSEKGHSLVGMLQPATLCPVAIRRQLQSILPAPAVPSVISCVGSMPTTRNGKVDLKVVAAQLAAA